ncbi:Ig-like domain-containing protein [Candidatus Bipolaricaulota bacterium]
MNGRVRERWVSAGGYDSLLGWAAMVLLFLFAIAVPGSVVLGAPTLTSVHIESSNFHSTWAKVGDTVTLTFSASEDVQNVSVTIATHAVTPSGGPLSWTATYDMQQLDVEGAVPFTIDFENLSGEPGSTSSSSTDGTSVTFDKTPPPAPSTPDLTTLSDAGKESTDNITNAAWPMFEGTASADSTEVLLFKDGAWERTELVTDEAWLVGMNAALTNGSYDMTATVLDAAGNMSDPSGPLTITVDTTDPQGSGIDLAPASDTGKSDSDGITRGVDPEFAGLADDVIAGGVASGIWKVEVWSDDGKTGTDEDGTYYSVTLATLDPGSRTVSGRVYDVAGNTFDLSSRPLLVDRAAPTGSVPDLAAATDTGDSNTDDITQGSAPQFTGTASDPWIAGVSSGVWKVVVSSDDGKSATDDDGAYYDVTLPALNEGNRSVEATVYDAAGNSYDTGALAVIVDRTAPSAPSTPDLTTLSDAGKESTDNITNAAWPMFEGTASADSTEVLLFKDGAWERTELVTDEAWLVGMNAALTNGSYDMTATVLDAAGNMSASSGALPVTIDTTAPGVSTPDLADASDTGQSNADGITKALAPQFTGSALDSGSGMWKVEVTGDDATTATDDDGTFYSVALALTEGARTVQATAYDVAGNTATSSGLPLLIDRMAPSGTAPDLAATSDTGSSDSDDVTQGNTPQFDGSATDGASGVWKVVVSSDDGKSATDDDGAYYDVTLATLNAGNRSVVATVHDKAGNTSTTDALAVTVDRTAPSVSGAAPASLADADAGSVTVNITFDEPMSEVDNLTATVQGINDSPIAMTYGSWPSSTVWRGTFTFTDDNETVTTAFYAISGAQDLAGNTMTALTSRGANNPLNVDTLNPTAVISVTDTLVTDADAGGTFTTYISFSESMDTSSFSYTPFPNTMKFDGTFSNIAYGFDTVTVPNDRFYHHESIADVGSTYVDVDIRAQEFYDLAGNALNPEPTWLYDAYTIDMTNPTATVTTDHTTVAGGSPIYEGSWTLTVTVTYDEDMDTTIPAISLVNAGGNWTGPSSIGWTGTTVYEANFTHNGNQEEIPGTAFARVSDVSGATDDAGNADLGDDSPIFDIDTRKPTVTSVSVDTNPIYEGDLTQEVTITFNEPMKTSVKPTVAITGITSPKSDSSSGTWNGNQQYVVTLTLDNDDEEDDVLDIEVSGAEDAAGNAQVAYTENDPFAVDTVKPVATVTVDHTTVAGGSPIFEDSLTLAVTVTYDESMDTSTEPTIILTDATWGPQTRVGPTGWSTTTETNDTYTATFAHTGVEEPTVGMLWAIAVTAGVSNGSGAKDLAGNEDIGDATDSPFEVDTRKPEIDTGVGVSGISVDTDPVYEKNLTQKVTITFDEAMDPGTDPTVSFSHGTWMSPGGSWTSALVWEETFTLVDNDEEYYVNPGSVVEVDVNGARDAAGNLQELYAEVPQFDIDTVKPRIIDVYSTTPDGCYTDGDEIIIVITFSEDITHWGTMLNISVDAGPGTNALATDWLDARTVRTSPLPGANAMYEVFAGHNSCDLTVDQIHTGTPGHWITDWAWNREDYSLTLPPGNYMRNGVTVPVGQNMAFHNDIVVDTTIPVAIPDPNGNEERSGSNDSTIVAVRWDPYGQYRLAVRENTPVYIDVTFNDSDLPCAEVLMIHDIPNPPDNGSAWFDDPAGNIRYAPDEDYVGPDEFTYRIYDACGNISLEETVYVEVVPLLVVEDQYLATCVDEPLEFDVTVADLFILEEEFTFTIFDGPFHGVVLGDLDDPVEGLHGLTTADLETLTVSLSYVAAAGYAGLDDIQVRVADAFGGTVIARVDILVEDCGVPVGPPGPDVSLVVGDVLSIVVPLSFEAIHDTAWETVTLTAVADGTVFLGALSASWNPQLGRFVMTVDTAEIPPGEYELVIPLGNDETVTLVIEVGES